MRKLLIILGIILLGCAVTERYVKIAQSGLFQTVKIEVEDDHAIRLGAGVFISKYGHILTCAHLFDDIENDALITVFTYSDRTFEGEVISIDFKRDLALVKVDYYNHHYASIVRPGTTQIGQEVIAVGHPFGREWTVTTGIISALHRDVFLYNAVQTNATINPGNSGGPLLNLQGKLVGINSTTFSPIFIPVNVGISYAVDSGQIWEFLAKFKGLNQSYN